MLYQSETPTKIGQPQTPTQSGEPGTPAQSGKSIQTFEPGIQPQTGQPETSTPSGRPTHSGELSVKPRSEDPGIPILQYQSGETSIQTQTPTDESGIESEKDIFSNSLPSVPSAGIILPYYRKLTDHKIKKLEKLTRLKLTPVYNQIRCIALRVCRLRMGFSVPSII